MANSRIRSWSTQNGHVEKQINRLDRYNVGDQIVYFCMNLRMPSWSIAGQCLQGRLFNQPVQELDHTSSRSEYDSKPYVSVL